ncbi:MAG TPA: putative DNA binding domain-containing protein [Rhodocyclaceae bacterium]|nr:putative DNA binding domain-containing protein [Rhodocyclaceae bacterium]HNA86291.1 putative DNA binding domain-containing protein [Nitrospira sp.]HNG03832.1 putative DNA binding domain-containing protein [Nitrospira sp.]HNM22600.1 putative DNA binding domain-containing protein [Rhodocyclaceae bacterium]
MNTADLSALLDRLRAEPRETEWLEFKANRYEPQVLGEYLSALANSACLLGMPRGYLVFGIEDGTHKVVGTTFDPQAEKGKGEQLLPLWLSLGLQPNVGFEIHAFTYHGQRVVLFEAHPAFDRPVKFYGTAYVRDGTSKTELAKYPEKERAIWNRRVDWSAQVCEQATPDDLAPEAIAKARQEYATKFPRQAGESAGWDDATFLNKARLTIRGAVTHAALLLLGRPEASALLAPAVARISWMLKNERNEELDYEHFGPPFLLNVDKVLVRIRNLTVRELPDGTLFPVELTQYDPWVIREALHNCIAHQDYGLRGRIQVVETPDSLLLTNVGGFLPGRVEKVIEQDAPLEIYRSPFLAEAMVNLNMIDTQGGGIKRMFLKQRQRFFPMPDYDLSQPERVMVTLRGRILDERYTRLLMAQSDLDLATIILLDKVQKGQRISADEAKRLRTAKLVEGRYPKLIVSGRVAAATGEKARHIRNRGFDSQYYRDLIVALVREHQPVSREDIDKLLLDKLPEVLTQEQKLNRIHNLLRQLAEAQLIQNSGSRRFSKWVLITQENNQ